MPIWAKVRAIRILWSAICRIPFCSRKTSIIRYWPWAASLRWPRSGGPRETSPAYTKVLRRSSLSSLSLVWVRWAALWVLGQRPVLVGLWTISKGSARAWTRPSTGSWWTSTKRAWFRINLSILGSTSSRTTGQTTTLSTTSRASVPMGWGRSLACSWPIERGSLRAKMW